MAKCSACSAPLAANSQICRYCGVRNDIDLSGRLDFHPIETQASRICPVCDIPLQTVALAGEQVLHIERCGTCYGLFFDPGEIETLLARTADSTYSVNRAWLDGINRERYAADARVKYLKCPVCRVLMNRVLYGYRSGVVVDSCGSHGIWLDGGQISHLMEWQRAGGRILANKRPVVKRPSSASGVESVKFSPGKSARDSESNDWLAVAELLVNLLS